MSNKMEIKNMELYYGDFKAIKGINLDIAPNEITAFIADSDTRRIESFCMCPDAFDGTSEECCPVFADIVVITCSVESPSSVQRLQIKGRQCPVHPCCGTVDHD